MRRLLVLVAAVVAVGVTAAVVVARTGEGGGRLDHQTFKWTNEQVSTSRTQWNDIRGLQAGTDCQKDLSTSALVSLELSPGSSPVEVRVAMDDPLSICQDCTAPEGLMRPRAVRFEGSSTFNFITRRAVGGHGTEFQVQWRLPQGSPPNASATLDSGTLNVLWKDFDEDLCA